MVKIVSKFALSLLLFFSFSANAQLNRRNDQANQQGNPSYQRQQQIHDSSFVDHLRWGFNGGLSFGYGGGYIEIDPQVGYQFNPQFIAGVGVSYSYIREAIFDPYSGQYAGSYSTSNYGGRLFAEYHFLPFLFAHAEYEAMNFDYLVYNTNTGALIDDGRVWVGNPMIGLGYKSPIGRKGYSYLMLLYDLNINDPRSAELYNYNPFVLRIGFMF